MNELLTRIGNSIYKDLLSEDTQKENAKEFIEKFDSLIKQRDTSDVWRQFVIFMLIDPAYGAIKFTKIGSIQYDAIQRVAQLYIDDCKDKKLWEAAASAAIEAGSAFYATKAAVAVAKNAAMYSLFEREAAFYAFGFYARLVPDQVNFFYDRLDFYGVDWAAHIKRMADRLIHLMRVAPRLSTTI